jgi:type II secretory pathway predicted ATPase ExeA
MYEEFFGLSEMPFSLLPNADFMFPSERHRRVINLLEYGIINQSSFMVISGDVGAGKTTIIRHFLKNIDPDVSVGIISNPSQTIGNLRSWITAAFELGNFGDDELKAHEEFIKFLLKEYSKGKHTVLIIDEAQNMTLQMLEDLRMLSNINNERDLLLQIILVGQPELLENLRKPELKQLVQRISVHYHLTPLSAAETLSYIHHRLGVVGGSPLLFDELACATAHYFSFGVPRLINLLCDQAMMYAFAEEKNKVSFDTVLEVVQDRNSSGLSAFRLIRKDMTERELFLDLNAVLEEIYESRE